jgi:hypothetical protein
MKILSFSIDDQPLETPSSLSHIPSDAGVIIRYGVTIAIIAAIILALFFLIWGGLQWITSGGDKAKLEGARKTLTFAVIGLIVVFLGFFIVNTLGRFFGVSLLR